MNRPDKGGNQRHAEAELGDSSVAGSATREITTGQQRNSISNRSQRGRDLSQRRSEKKKGHQQQFVGASAATRVVGKAPSEPVLFSTQKSFQSRQQAFTDSRNVASVPGAVSSLVAPSTNRGLSKTRSKSPKPSNQQDNGAEPGAVPTISAPSTNRGLSKTRSKSPKPSNQRDHGAEPGAEPGAVPVQKISAPSTNRGLSKSKSKSSKCRPAPVSLVVNPPKFGLEASSSSHQGETLDLEVASLSTSNHHVPSPAGSSLWDGGIDTSAQHNKTDEEEAAASLPTDEELVLASYHAKGPDLQGLIEATPINDERSMSLLPQAEMVVMDNAAREKEASDNEKRRKERQCKIIGAIIVGICTLVIILSVVFGTRTKTVAMAVSTSAAPSISDMPSVSPSSMPSEASLSSRPDIKGLSESAAEAITKQGSPQQRAYEWTFGHPEFEEMPNWRRLQLFALGTFYYSFENWPDDYQWMDYSNTECSWTTDLDSPELGGSTSSWRPPGYSAGNFCSDKSNCCSPTRPNPFDSNCNDEGNFYYMKLRLSRWGAPPVHGTLPPEVFLLTGITIFDVRSAGIAGSIPSEIGMLSILTNLNLQTNQITGQIPSEIGFLTDLDDLNIGGNAISGSVPTSIGQTNLTRLLLEYNELSGSLPSELGLLSFLQRVDLAFNQITGPLPSELGSFTRITRLDARNNTISGLPTELGLMTDLLYLLLRDNAIAGTLPSEIGNLSNMMYLSLERNLITGAFPSTFNHSGARQFDLQGNRLTDIPTEIGNLGNDIYQLDLSKNMIATLPSEMFLLTSLSKLQLHGNQIKRLPKEIEQMTNLEPCGGGLLSLNENKLTSIPTEIASLANLWSWTMNSNAIASLPGVDWSSLSNLRTIQLSHNSLDSSIPSQLALLQQLMELDLSSNALIGSIPSEIGNLENSSSCWRVDPVFGGYESNCDVLLLLDLHNNSLTGSLSTEMGRLTGLAVMDISFNKISGPIPSELGQLLTTLMEYNSTLDEYVEQEAYMIQTLDLSNNQLSGWLPSELGLLTSLETLDLSFNGLTGSIPSELGNLNSSSSQILLLGNNFSGILPETLCPWYCMGHLCSMAGVSCSMTALLEVDCSSASLVDCSVCTCF
ncbi:leucine rich repeat [Seminavis robusta]|uniref:Leucine rich repeat n=1 Tax=Seminavis robusta TaxID=568900 RepID=A0A9N8EZN1_9STRA|nr:leucine rich repeat [Seminavis robusta]|eukprot:Sro2339_g323980.1 leucine rich repeat (1116) ;mRNA; r:6480-9908